MKLSARQKISIIQYFMNMKKYLFHPSLGRLLICLGILSLTGGISLPGKMPSWQLVWSDEFNYTGLPDPAKWNYDSGGGGWGNNELEFYTVRRPENARVENGHLIIEARKEKWENRNYTSARLVTKGKGDWKFGRIEVRAKLPKGLGTWPAIWMLSSTTPLRWPDDGEIDIMEEVGFDPGVIHASVHCKKYNHVIHTQKTAVITVPDFSDNFHDYTLEWDTDSISIFVDQKKYFHFANEHSGYEGWPFDQKGHLLLNIAVGGNWGGVKGIDDSLFPQQMLIDYVRVYQQVP
jgi:beta-glucanase (GH16 family)